VNLPHLKESLKELGGTMTDLITVSIVLTPLKNDELNLKTLADKIKNDNIFRYNKSYNNFLIELYSEDEYTKVLLYSNGMINYTKYIGDNDFSSNSVYTILENCFALLKRLNINIEYAKNLGLFITGNSQKTCYEEHIHKFGQTVFQTPNYKDMSLPNDKKQCAVFIEENTLVSFEL